MPSYKQYMNLSAREVASMTEKEMRAAVRSMQKVVGARMSRLEMGGYRSPAERWMRERGGIYKKYQQKESSVGHKSLLLNPVRIPRGRQTNTTS